MPFAYFICAVTGEKADPQTCLACARNGSLPGWELIKDFQLEENHVKQQL